MLPSETNNDEKQYTAIKSAKIVTLLCSEIRVSPPIFNPKESFISEEISMVDSFTVSGPSVQTPNFAPAIVSFPVPVIVSGSRVVISLYIPERLLSLELCSIIIFTPTRRIVNSSPPSQTMQSLLYMSVALFRVKVPFFESPS